jgi:hypothetical protein
MTTTERPLTGPWSYSRATACSLALYKEKVLRLPPEPRPERLTDIDRTDFGSVLHLGANAIVRSILTQDLGDDFPWSQETRADARAGKVTDSETLARELVTVYGHLAPAVKEIADRLTVFGQRFRCDRDMTVDERNAAMRDRVIFCEHALAVTADGRPAPFDTCPSDGWRGKIDYAEDNGDGCLTIIDFKNRPAMFSDAELLASEQLSGYLWLTTCHYPQFTKLRVGIYYFQFGVTQIVEIDREAMKVNVDRLMSRAAHKSALARDAIGPEPGFGKCQYCRYLTSCEAGTRALEPSLLVPTDRESALATARWLVVNEEKVDAARKALKAFTAEHGGLRLDDETEVGFSAVERVRYDKDGALRVLKALIDGGKIDGRLSQFTSLDLAGVKKAAKDKVVDAALETARSREMETKFDIFRPHKRVALKPGPKAPADASGRKVSGRVKTTTRE